LRAYGEGVALIRVSILRDGAALEEMGLRGWGYLKLYFTSLMNLNLIECFS
jgi:hypothetical protein